MRIITKEGSIELNLAFIHEIKQRSGQPIELCYQCQKCTSGCPVSSFTDYHPSQILRMIQFGLKERVLNSSFIWLCSNCETCGARCPNGIRISEVTDTLREMALELKLVGKERKVPLFHDSFLSSVKAYGRIHEASMLSRYKLKSGTLFEDLSLGFKLFKRGKFPVLPVRIKKRKQIKEIFQRCTGN